MWIILIYILAIVSANLSIAEFGPWVSPINAFFLIGLDLSLRDFLHEKWSNNRLFLKMLGLILVASAISYMLNPATGMIAIASSIAFLCANSSDAIVYHILKKRTYIEKSNASNMAGALVDSIIFPTLAFGVLMPNIVAMQFLAKTFGGAIWSFIIMKLKTRKNYD